MKMDITSYTVPIPLDAIAKKDFSFASGSSGGISLPDFQAGITAIISNADANRDIITTQMAANTQQIVDALGAVIAAINAHP